MANPYVRFAERNYNIVKYIPFLNTLPDPLKITWKTLFAFYDKQIEEHSRIVDPNSEPTDYVEAFLREKAKKEAENDPTAEFYSYETFLDVYFLGLFN